MTDHYELLGVESDATKDEIKAAYRSEVEGADSSRRAQLNRAWNVLSDPIQRQRYDEQLHSGDGGGSDGGDEAVVVAGRRATGARRGPESATGNGSSNNGSGKGGGGGSGGGGGGGDGDDGSDDDVPMRGGRPVPQPTVELPEGMHLAEKKQRGFSILFDLSVVIVIVLLCQFLLPKAVSSDYTKNTDIVNAQVKKIDRAQDREDEANDQLDKANAAAKKAAKSGDTTAEQDAKDQAAKFKARANDAAADKKAAEKVRDDAADKTQGPLLVASAVAFVLSLLYCVPMTALTGQSPGKRLRKLWLVRVDGSRVGWTGAFAHYAVPLAIGIAIPQLGALVAMGMVFWSLRDRNEQGLHDKLARTLVVDSPPVSS